MSNVRRRSLNVVGCPGAKRGNDGGRSYAMTATIILKQGIMSCRERTQSDTRLELTKISAVKPLIAEADERNLCILYPVFPSTVQ